VYQRLHVNRLSEHTRELILVEIADVGPRDDHDGDLRRCRMRRQLSMNIAATEARQREVQNHGAGHTRSFDVAERVQAVFDGDDRVTRDGQRRSVKSPKIRIVLDDKDRRLLRSEKHAAV
jgi:hypothetical protein